MHDDTTTLLDSLLDRSTELGSVDAVYGDPIERGDRTVVPVARVAWGFGGGGGQEDGPASIDAADDTDDDTVADEFDDERGGSGVGFGGGVRASPVGALEVTDEGTRFVRFGEKKTLLAVAAVAFLVGVLFGRR
jgi:uncharacterized spore protein YtfJ